MEYLMTYGWAILIIAVVIAVLYYLGAFSSANLAPRAQPGSCQVFRPNGPGTSYDAGLSGTCNNELPEYVAQFNGASSYISAPSSSSLDSMTTAMTICSWVNTPNPLDDSPMIVTKSDGSVNAQFELRLHGLTGETQLVSDIGGSYDFQVNGEVLAANTWYYVCGVYNGADIYVYVNGAAPSPQAASGSINIQATQPLIIGARDQGTQFFLEGSISNVQVYNTSLSQNEIAALYDEGIGGAPINPAYVVGWWPLNGNPNDYSGNLNNGAATAVTYTSSWTSGYSAP